MNYVYPAWPIDAVLDVLQATPDDKNVALCNALWSITTKYIGTESDSMWYFRQSTNASMRPSQDGGENFLLTYLYQVILPSIYRLMREKAITSALDDNVGSSPPPKLKIPFLMLTLVATLFIKFSIETLSEDIYKHAHPHTNVALILYTLEYDVQCRLEQLIFPTLGSAIDISKIPQPSQPTEVCRPSSNELAHDFCLARYHFPMVVRRYHILSKKFRFPSSGFYPFLGHSSLMSRE